jgi:hypothetical protein
VRHENACRESRMLAKREGSLRARDGRGFRRSNFRWPGGRRGPTLSDWREVQSILVATDVPTEIPSRPGRRAGSMGERLTTPGGVTVAPDGSLIRAAASTSRRGRLRFDPRSPIECHGLRPHCSLYLTGESDTYQYRRLVASSTMGYHPGATQHPKGETNARTGADRRPFSDCWCAANMVLQLGLGLLDQRRTRIRAAHRDRARIDRRYLRLV